jgi:hypothetical protein
MMLVCAIYMMVCMLGILVFVGWLIVVNPKEIFIIIREDDD